MQRLYAILLTSCLMSACVNAGSAPVKTTFSSDAPTSLFMSWDHDVSNRLSAPKIGAQDLSQYYIKTGQFSPDMISSAWIKDMAKVAANNPSFKADILTYKGAKKTELLNSLKKYPHLSANFTYSKSAFSDVLKDIQQRSKKHHIKMDQLKAFGYRQKFTKAEKLSINSPVGYFVISDYMSEGRGRPSVMERILGLSVFNILQANEEPEYKNFLASLSNSPEMEGCFQSAKQNAAQCKAASHDHYDLSFCLAKHNIGEVSSCTSWMLP